MATEQFDLSRLRGLLIEHFSNDDLIVLCADLGVDIDTISKNQSSKEVRVLEVVEYFRRRGQLGVLLSRCTHLRPNASWATAVVERKGLSPFRSQNPSVNKSGESSAPIAPRYEELLKKLKDHVNASSYDLAASIGDQELDSSILDSARGNRELVGKICECFVWFAHALIYIGHTDRALGILDGVLKFSKERWVYEQMDRDSTDRILWNRVFGRAHNHRGYARWMNKGEYQTALYEFAQALPHCIAEESLYSELATVYDNMGRIYTQLGYRSSAELLIEEGMWLRKGRNAYREALSLNSLAICRLTFGQTGEAIMLADKARLMFEGQAKMYGRRGVGLALLTKGKALRFESVSQRLLHESTQSLDDDNKQQAMIPLNQAKRALTEAQRIFEEIGEEVRIIEVLNELGCVERDLRQLGAENEKEAKEKLRDSIRQAKDKYPVLYIDACEDLAQMFYNMKKYPDAEEAVAAAEGGIPNSYRLDRDALQLSGDHSVDDTLVEEYWQELGKIYLLKGHIKLLNVTMPTGFPDNPLPKNLEYALQAYAQASGYFDLFLSRLAHIDGGRIGSRLLFPDDRPSLANHHLYKHQIYEKLRELNRKEIEFIRLELLPELIKKAQQFHPEVSGLLLREVFNLLFLIKSGLVNPTSSHVS